MSMSCAELQRCYQTGKEIANKDKILGKAPEAYTNPIVVTLIILLHSTIIKTSLTYITEGTGKFGGEGKICSRPGFSVSSDDRIATNF